MAGRRRSPKARAAPRRSRIVHLYLTHGYAADAAFRDALDALSAMHRPALTELARRGVMLQYRHLGDGISGVSLRTADSLAAIRSFAQAWKLDLLFEGCDTLCDWLDARLPPRSLAPVFDDGMPMFPFDATMPDSDVGARDFPDYAPLPLPREPDDVEYNPDGVAVLVRVDGAKVGTYAPDWETFAEAYGRMEPLVPVKRRGALRAALNRIRDAYDDAGSETPDAEPRKPDHAAWLYRHVVKGESYADIARTLHMDETAVRAGADSVRAVLGMETAPHH